MGRQFSVTKENLTPGSAQLWITVQLASGQPSPAEVCQVLYFSISVNRLKDINKRQKAPIHFLLAILTVSASCILPKMWGWQRGSFEDKRKQEALLYKDCEPELTIIHPHLFILQVSSAEWKRLKTSSTYRFRYYGDQSLYIFSVSDTPNHLTDASSNLGDADKSTTCFRIVLGDSHIFRGEADVRFLKVTHMTVVYRARSFIIIVSAETGTDKDPIHVGRPTG